VLRRSPAIASRITGVDRKTRIISLSIKAKEVHEEQQALQNYKSDSGRTSTGTTLGDLLKEQMNTEE
jgi:small subunit ribosomal protein S1